MELRKPDYMGIKHDKINDFLEGDLTFINYMCIDIAGVGNHVAAVYKARKPNLKKGHKKYVLLFTDPNSGRVFVSGRSPQKMIKEKMHSGVLCPGCNTVVLSLYRHDFQQCGCELETFADGGKDYLRVGSKKLDDIKFVSVNLLTDEIKVQKKKINVTKSKRKIKRRS